MMPLMPPQPSRAVRSSCQFAASMPAPARWRTSMTPAAVELGLPVPRSRRRSAHDSRDRSDAPERIADRLEYGVE